jgi:hypothetical protein
VSGTFSSGYLFFLNTAKARPEQKKEKEKGVGYLWEKGKKVSGIFSS